MSNNLSKPYKEIADCPPTYILLSEIVKKCITSEILAAMISSAKTKKFISKNCLNICCRNACENWIIYDVFFKKGPCKIKSVGKLWI